MADRENITYCICKYTPCELIEAYGGHWEILNEEPVSFEKSEQKISTNVCGFGKSIIEAVRTRGIKELVLVDCCDTIKSVYDLLEYEGELDFLYMLNVMHSGGECEREVFAEELVKFGKAYGKYKGTGFDPGLFKNAFAQRLKPAGSPYIGVLGARIGSSTFNTIKNIFSTEVRNLTCVNNRDVMMPRCIETPDSGDETPGGGGDVIPGGSCEMQDIMKEYAACILGQLPCMRMYDKALRRDLFVDPDLQAVIYNTVKFCDFYGFEFSSLKNKLDMPVLKIETDFSLASKGQLLTRLEAFEETLSARGKGKMEDTRMTQEYMDFLEKRFAEDGERSAPHAGDVSGLKYAAGIDSGSTSTEAVILRSDGTFVSKGFANTGAKASESAEAALEEACSAAGIKKEDISVLISTGYGRQTVDSDSEITEISCHALGARMLCPGVRTVIDIGGQDSKVIAIGEDGTVENFTMNDKCAAGTGRFLDMTAMTLELDREEMGNMGLEYNEDLSISSTCSVFAQSEIVSLVAEDKEINDIVHGVNKAIASKVMTLVARVNGEAPYFMTGGVSKNKGLVKALEEQLKEEVKVCDDSMYCGAIGAALYALKEIMVQQAAEGTDTADIKETDTA